MDQFQEFVINHPIAVLIVVLVVVIAKGWEFLGNVVEFVRCIFGAATKPTPQGEELKKWVDSHGKDK